MFKVNKRNIGTRCEICSKLIIKTPERRHRSGVLIINFEHISRLVLVFLFLTLSRQMPTGSIFVVKTTERSSRSFYVHLFKDLRITPSWITFVNHQTSWLVYANEFSWIIQSSEAAVRRCSVKKMFWEISQNSLEKNCARVSFLQNTFGRLLLNHIYLPRK